MAEIILITGGARSGKSDYARRIGEALPGPRVYVATCPPLDEEMRARIERHQREREAGGWRTLEAPEDPAAALRSAPHAPVALVDCLTLWINNLMFGADGRGEPFDEERVAARCAKLLAACAERPGAALFVTNEVAMGIVPENPAARRYRDLVGRCNQIMAAAANQVIFMVCGVPVVIKGKDIKP